MVSLKLMAPLIALAVAAPAPEVAPAHSLYASRELWATVDVCSPKDKPDTVGIRGSMPSDGHKGDTMYMSFRVQYFDAAKKQWVNVAKEAESAFLPVSATAAASQLGRDFQLVPTAGPFRLRGVVDFQWRQGTKVVFAATRLTTAGHKASVGADPAGYSSATCKIG